MATEMRVPNSYDTDSTEDAIPALSTGAAPRIAVEATEEASPPPVPAIAKLTINGTSESMLKVHTARPMPKPISTKPPVISGMNPTRCSMEPPNRDAGMAGTAIDTTRAPASNGVNPPAVWNRWVVISSTPATTNITRPTDSTPPATIRFSTTLTSNKDSSS